MPSRDELVTDPGDAQDKDTYMYMAAMLHRQSLDVEEQQGTDADHAEHTLETNFGGENPLNCVSKDLDGSANQDADDEDYDSTNELAVPDGGWGWMCVLGCTLMHFCLGGNHRCYGVIYVEVKRVFNSSSTAGTFVGGLFNAVRMSGSPMATALSTRFTARQVVFTGGLIMSLGMITSSFTPNAEFLFFSYSFLTGLGGTLAYAPSIVVVGQYFNKRRALATGIACAGAGLGTFIYPPLFDLLLRCFGYRGTMLVFGAFVLHICVSGALLRPIETQRRLMAVRSRRSSSVRPVDQKHADLKQNGDPKVDTSSPKKGLHRYLDLSLLRNPTFVCYALSMGLITMAYVTAHMLVADLAIEHGHSFTQGALVLSVLGITDMTGRLLSGVVFDLPFIRPIRRHVFNGCQLISAMTIVAYPFAKTYPLLMANTALHSLFSGATVAQRATVVVDLIGVEHLSSAFGLTVFVQGVCLMFGPLLAGFLKDYTGVYMWSFLFAGACALAAAGLLLGEYLCFQRSGRRKTAHKQLNENQSKDIKA